MKRLFKLLRDLLEVIIAAVVITFILFNFVLFSADVVGSSMYDTLEHGDRGFSFIITRNIKIKRFDICVIDSDKCHNLIIKRVIGLPNDKLVYANNKLYINGEELREEYLNGAITEDFEIQLKDDEYFVMGDNRQVSNDSRYYGTFKKDEIVATNFFVFYPFNRIGFK